MNTQQILEVSLEAERRCTDSLRRELQRKDAALRHYANIENWAQDRTGDYCFWIGFPADGFKLAEYALDLPRSVEPVLDLEKE